MKMAIFIKENALRPVENLENHDMESFQIGNEQLGAMRQKMAIFKEGNSVWRVHFFQELSFYVQKESPIFKKASILLASIILERFIQKRTAP